MTGESASLSSEPAATGAPTVLPLREIGKQTGQWTLTLHPAHLALADAPGAQPYVLLREQLMKSVVLMEGTRALVVQQPHKVMFKLTPDGVRALAEWIGRPFLASFYLKRRYTWVSLWAFLWVVGSLATLLPAPRFGITPQFDLTIFLLGVALLVAAGFAKWRPHPILFLVDGIWFACVAVHLAVNVLTHNRSRAWLVFAAVMIWMAVTGVKHFIRFRGTKLEPERK